MCVGEQGGMEMEMEMNMSGGQKRARRSLVYCFQQPPFLSSLPLCDIHRSHVTSKAAAGSPRLHLVAPLAYRP